MEGRTDLEDDLRRPEAYPGDPREVGFLQTHISRLFFAGERVYKVKKPVDLGFLDFTTPERRRHFCEEEVRLNRRLAPDVYLGVVPVLRDDAGRHSFVGSGEPVDWAVEMVRLPEERMLPRLLDRGELDNALMDELARVLSDFHARAATGPGVDEHGSPEAVRRNAEENFEELEPFVGTVATRAQHAFLARCAREALERQRELFARRVAEGRIRDGHGDLHAGNICFTAGGIVAYDCIEFASRFRCGDVAADLAFLAMDLDDRGYPAFSAYLVRRYRELADDAEVTALLGFYKGYRAIVRAKVGALTARDPSVGDAERARLVAESMRYVQLAADYELPPALVLACGLPASGKSWLAERIAPRLRAVLLHSDVRRKTLAGAAPTARMGEAYGEGLYGRENRQRTYASLLEDALEALGRGHSVVVDATFSERAFRDPFADACRRHGHPLFVVHVTAPEALVRERLEQRARDRHAVSDADLAVYLRARETFEPPDELGPRHAVQVESRADPPEVVGSLLTDRRIADADARDA